MPLKVHIHPPHLLELMVRLAILPALRHLRDSIPLPIRSHNLDGGVQYARRERSKASLVYEETEVPAWRHHVQGMFFIKFVG
jgi:hypothetical protein